MELEHVAAVLGQLENEQAAAAANYRRIIRIPQPSPADQRALIDAMRVLRKTPDQLRADIRALSRVAELEARIAEALGQMFSDPAPDISAWEPANYTAAVSAYLSYFLEMQEGNSKATADRIRAAVATKVKAAKA